MRGVLYCSQYFVADSGHEVGQAGGDSVRAAVAGFAVCAFRETEEAGGVREFAAGGAHVRRGSRGGAGDAGGVGARDGAVTGTVAIEKVAGVAAGAVCFETAAMCDGGPSRTRWVPDAWRVEPRRGRV